jgi:hypothetical protein
VSAAKVGRDVRRVPVRACPTKAITSAGYGICRDWGGGFRLISGRAAFGVKTSSVRARSLPNACPNLPPRERAKRIACMR